MSKARELARELQKDLYEYPYEQLGKRFHKLCDAVLSEPEPDLKGWIEVTGRDGNKKLINLALVERVDVDTKSGVYLEFNRDDCVAYVKESYDSIKQKIREAS